MNEMPTAFLEKSSGQHSRPKDSSGSDVLSSMSTAKPLDLHCGHNHKESAVDKLAGILKDRIPEDADRHWLRETRLEGTGLSD